MSCVSQQVMNASNRKQGHSHAMFKVNKTCAQSTVFDYRIVLEHFKRAVRRRLNHKLCRAGPLID